MTKRKSKTQPIQIKIGYMGKLLTRERAIAMLGEAGLSEEAAVAYLDKPTPHLHVIRC